MPLEVRTLKALLCAIAIGVVPAHIIGQDAATAHIVEQEPVSISKISPDTFLIDFGRAAFANLSLAAHAANATQEPVTVSFGEALKDGRIDTHPPGTVRYSKVTVTPKSVQPSSSRLRWIAAIRGHPPFLRPAVGRAYAVSLGGSFRLDR